MPSSTLRSVFRSGPRFLPAYASAFARFTLTTNRPRLIGKSWQRELPGSLITTTSTFCCCRSLAIRPILIFEMANGIRPRFGPPDRIRYLLFGGAREPLTVHIPVTLSRGYLHQLQLMPKAQPQFLDPIAWHKKTRSINCFRHYDFGVVYDDAPAEIVAEEIRSKALTVIFLQSRLPDFWQIIREHSDKCLVLSADDRITADFTADEKLRPTFCVDATDFFAKLTPLIAGLSGFEMEAVENAIQTRLAELKKALIEIDDNANVGFKACAPNTHAFLQLFAPYGRDLLEWEDVEHSKRPAALIKSAERVLSAFSVVTAKDPDAAHGWPEFWPPLVLTWPYYGPNHKALFKSFVESQSGKKREALKIMQQVALGEQDPKTYEYSIETSLLKDQEAVFTAIREFQVKMVEYMDNVGYLHASFQDSPYLRMPLTGKSVNEPLGSFQESCVGPSATTKKAIKRLRKVGEALAARFPPGFLAHIDRYYDQLVAITDIPIEWSVCDGVPLSFLVDICRLPQSDPSSIMAQYAANVAIGYSVKPNILEKTLVICGVGSTEPIGELFDKFASNLKGIRAPGPVAVRCLTKAEFIAAIEHYQPDLLIVDSHGNFESNQEGSYLVVGNEKIVGDDIPTIKHSVPLVILSCCLTSPLYGCPNTIAQAFFEAHSLSVVSTFLPISVDRGYLLYQRILKNLAAAAKTAYHRNWLSFISHCLRTSHFDDYLFPLREALGEMEDFQLFFDSRTPWMVASMNPGKRRQTYRATKEAVINCFRPALRANARHALESPHLIPEAFYYTHLGRADLIQFDVWLQGKAALDSEAKLLYEDVVRQFCL